MKIAIFTMVYNDHVFLPLWRKHYGQAVGNENLFVIDHGSDDGSTEGLGGVQTIRVPRREGYDEVERAAFVNRFQATLLSYYDVVVFTDADEFLVPDPDEYSGLTDFITRRCDRFVSAVGLELYHLPDNEADIDLSQSILAQRSLVRFSGLYCKTLISKIPLNWYAGFHQTTYQPAINPDLYLFHLKRLDLGLALNRLATTRAISWSDHAIEQNHSHEHRFSDEEFKARLFPYTRTSLDENIRRRFDFVSDISKLQADPPDYLYQGSFALIPRRFGDLIAGIKDELPAAAKNSPPGGVRSIVPVSLNDPQRVTRALWGDVSPYVNFPHLRYRADPQGWNSQHPYLAEGIRDLRPAIIVEVGVWKGASIISMANAARECGSGSTLIAVDTWLGSAEHWDNPDWRAGLLFNHGYPALYYTFLTNMIEQQIQDMVVPLPLDSQGAYQVLEARQIRPSMIHLDAAHDYASVANDLRRWWDLLEPGGIMIADDYDANGVMWREVQEAVDQFLGETPHERFEASPWKCRFFKPR